MIRAAGALLILAALAILGLDLATSANAPGGLSAATFRATSVAWALYLLDSRLGTHFADDLTRASSAVASLPASLVLGIPGLALILVRPRRGGHRGKPAATAAAAPAANAGSLAPAAGAPRKASASQPDAQPPRPSLLALTQDATDREFLPAALEILETPPSPIRVQALWFICLAFAGALLLSWFGRIDIHAVAQGRIQPSGRSKVVQPFEPGVVSSLNVVNGQQVTAGDVLLVLDPTETTADREALARDLESAHGEAARRRVAVAEARAGTMRVEAIAFPSDVGETVRKREELVLASELGQLKSTLSSLEAQIDEKNAMVERLKGSIAARAKLLALTQERVDMRETINAQGSLSRAMVIESLQQHETQKIAQATETGQVTETQAAIVTLERKVAETISQFVAEQSQKLTEAERKADRTAQDLVKARSKNERTALRAPIAGTVQQLAVTTIGQVVTTGQALLTIVPSDAPVEIEAFVQNQDIGFVESGQPAVVKIDAFPFTRFGTLDGKILRVSRDAVEERDAAQLADPTNAVRSQASAATQPTTRGQTLVFPTTIALARSTMPIDGKEIPLMPGMAVTVEILTGHRRAIDYVLSPLREIASKAAHER